MIYLIINIHNGKPVTAFHSERSAINHVRTNAGVTYTLIPIAK